MSILCYSTKSLRRILIYNGINNSEKNFIHRPNSLITWWNFRQQQMEHV